jgi:hypothetical protein
MVFFLDNTNIMRRSITTFTLIILALLVSVIIAQGGGDPTGQTLAENGASTDSPTGQPETGGTTQNMGSTGNTNQNSGTNGPTDGGQMTESSTAMMQTTGEQYTTMMPVMTTTMMPVVATTMAPITSTLMMTTMPASTARPTVAMTTTQKNHGVTVYPHQYLLAFFVTLLLIL